MKVYAQFDITISQEEPDGRSEFKDFHKTNNPVGLIDSFDTSSEDIDPFFTENMEDIENVSAELDTNNLMKSFFVEDNNDTAYAVKLISVSKEEARGILMGIYPCSPEFIEEKLGNFFNS